MSPGDKWPVIWLFTNEAARDRKQSDLYDKYPDWGLQAIAFKRPIVITTRDLPNRLN